MSAKTKGVVAYLVMAFGGAWILWSVPLLAGVPATSPQFQFAALPGGFAPAVAAIVVRKWVTREGFADAGLRPRLRRGWPYYLFAWLLPLAVVAVIVVLALILGAGRPDLTLGRGLQELYPGGNTPSFLAPGPLALLVAIPALLVQAVIFIPVLWGEEFGWRSYLQIRLLADQPILAAVVTGLIWGVWHYPLILAGYDRYDNPLSGMIIFTVSTVLLSIIFGWLRLSTGSIWCSSLAHSSTNSVGGSLTMLLFLGGGDYTLVSYLGVLAFVPLGVLCAWIVFSGRLDSYAVRRASAT